MRRLSLVALLVLGVVALFSADALACKGCGCSKKKAATACSKKAGCPVKASLAKAKLTPEQKKKVDAIMAECKAACKKAAAGGCPNKAKALKAEAQKGLKAKLLAVLTADQKKIVEPAFAKAKAGCCPKSAGAAKAKVCGGK